MEIYARNVNEAFNKAVRRLCDGEGMWQRQPSRNGDTLEFLEPVTTCYFNPQERVLLNAARDPNPFLHLFESLWMLAGRRDLKFMTTLVKRFSDYSDGNQRMQGSYGYRWCRHFGVNQLDFLVKHLQEKPDSRRAVLAMWDPEYDLLGDDYGSHVEAGINSKDIPCNTHVYFKIRDGKLNMTVCNRSNDLLWGAYGANAVHMSILQEYMAARLGVPVGTYRQFSDSLHVYLGGPGGEVWGRVQGWMKSGNLWRTFEDPYESGLVEASPMFLVDGHGVEEWEQDLHAFFSRFDELGPVEYSPTFFRHPWWKGTARPMWNAWRFRSLEMAETIQASDWRKAAGAWLAVHPGKEVKS